jgi:hypothetical protein
VCVDREKGRERVGRGKKKNKEELAFTDMHAIGDN